jgi:hypothetical protein
MNDATQFFNTTAGGGYEIERSLRFNSSDSAYLSKNSRICGQQEDVDLGGVGEEECFRCITNDSMLNLQPLILGGLFLF